MPSYMFKEGWLTSY